MISRLGNKELMEILCRAIEMELEKDFISLLEDEILCRGMNVEEKDNMFGQ
jgi:hypothetical protein